MIYYLLATALIMIADPNRTSKLFPWGHCPVCDGKVVYPGLDGFKCAGCGWLKNTEVEMLLRKQARKLAKAHKHVTSSPARENLGESSKSSSSLTSLLNSS